MTLVFVCHPWHGKKTYQEQTKRICWYLILQDKTVPFSPALHFSQFLSDDVYEQRMAGVHSGLHILAKCDAIYVFKMQGISEGMQIEIDFAVENKINIIEFDKYPWEKNV